MSWAYVGEIADGSEKNSDTSLAVSVSTAASADDFLVAVAVVDNPGYVGGGTNHQTSYLSLSDSQSNTWTNRMEWTYTQSDSIESGVTAAIFTSELSTALSTSDTITLNTTNAVTAKALTVWEFSHGGDISLDDWTGGGSNSTTAYAVLNPSSGSSLRISFPGIENKDNISISTPTNYTAFSTRTGTGTSGGGETNVSGQAFYRIVDSSSQDYHTETIGTTVDWAQVAISLLEAAITLAPADTAHGLTSDNVVLAQDHTLVVQETAHGLISDNVVLTQDHTLVVQETAHGLVSDNVTLTQHHTLVVNDTAHGLISDEVVVEPHVYQDDSNLQGLWLFENSSDLGEDALGQNDLTNNNGVSQNGDSKEGDYSGSFVRSSSQTLSISDASQTGLDITGSITFGGWLKPTSFSASSIHAVICKYDNNSGAWRSWLLQLNTDASDDTRASVWVSSDGNLGPNAYTSPGTISEDSWQHVAVVYDGSYVTIYIDGEVSSNGSNNPLSYSSGLYDTPSDFVIGDQSTEGIEYNGLLDEMFVFDRALSQGEIRALFNHGIEQTVIPLYPADTAHALSSDNVVLTQDHTLVVQETAHGLISDEVVVEPAVYDDDTAVEGIWNFENSSDLGEDSGPNSNDLTNTNSVTQATDQKEGTYSSEYDNSSNQYLTITDASQTGLDVTGSFSMGGWVKVFDFGSPDDRHIMGKWNITLSARCYEFAVTANGGLEAGISNDGTTQYKAITNGSLISINTWYHCFMVYDGSEIIIYLDGDIPGGTNPLTYSSGVHDDTDANFNIARMDGATTRDHDGRLDEILFFSRALSQGEIRNIMNNGLQQGVVTLVPADTAHGLISDNVTLTQDHTLVVQETAHGLVSDNVDLVQHHTLVVQETAHGLVSDNVDLAQTHVLAVQETAHGLTSDVPSLTQYHTLAVDEASHGLISDNVDLTQAHTLVVQETAHGLTSDNVTLDVTVDLEPADAVHSHVADNITLTQTHVLVVQETAHGLTSDNLDLVENIDLTVADAAHTLSSDNVDLSQSHILTVNDAVHAQIADGGLVLTENIDLAPADAVHSQVADNVVLTQAHTLVVQETAHTLVSDNVTLVVQGALEVQDAVHGHVADAPALTQHHALTLADATHGHTAEGVTLTQAHTLAIQETAHSLVSDNVVLTQHHTLVVAETVHTQTADGVVLTQDHVLVVQETVHTHVADNVELQLAGALEIQDAGHSHSAENVVLAQAHTLIVQEASHGLTSDNLDLVENIDLVVQETAHAHSADGLVLTQQHTLVVQETAHVLVTDGDLVLVQHHTLVVEETLHSQSAENVDLAQTHILAVAETIHAHTADNVTLDVASVSLIVQNAQHGLTSDVPALTQNHILTVQDGWHQHTAQTVQFVAITGLMVLALGTRQPSMTLDERQPEIRMTGEAS